MPTPIRPSGRRTRVLVVEDHEDTRELYAKALRAAGFEVLTANNRKEGVILAHTYRVDVATIDLGIAGGGTPLAAALSGLPKPPRLIAVTGRARDDAPDPNLFAQYLVKPVLPDALVEVVKTEAIAARPSSPSST
jgi:two-component system, OmpR family, phosphate regulon response regulator PhoB